MKHLLLLWVIFIASFGHVFASKISFAEKSRSPRIVHYSGPCDSASVQEYLNSLDLGDTESEDEVKNLVEHMECVDHLQIFDGRNERIEILDLNEEFFRAAVESAYVARLRQLIGKKKHLLLNSSKKAKVFKYALNPCINVKDSSAAFGEIFKMLLEGGFYPENGHLPFTRFSGDNFYPLMSILHDPLLYQAFLDYDEDFFAKVKSRNYVSRCIKLRNYSLARMALSLGFDPNVEYIGRNALDHALDVPRNSPLTAKEEAERQDLIRILISEYKMEPSRTIVNLGIICLDKKENWEKRAVELVRLGGMKWKDISPIGYPSSIFLENWEERAIELVRSGGMKWEYISPIGHGFSHQSAKLVNAAIDMYIEEVPMKQLEKDLEHYRPDLVSDPQQRKLLADAVERIKTLKNLDSIKLKERVL